MTVASTTIRASYAGDGSTTAFSTGFYFIDNADLRVSVIVDATGVETVKTITTHYTVSGAGGPGAGTVTFVTAPASGETVLIILDPSRLQSLDFSDNPRYSPAAVEKQFDRRAHVAMRLSDRLDRALRLPDAEASISVLDKAADRANKIISFDENGDLELVTRNGEVAPGEIGTVELADGGVTPAKLANMAQATLLGRASGAGTGVPSAQGASAVRTIVGTGVTRNRFPNARFLVATALSVATKYDATGTAMGSVSISSYTTGSNTCVCSTSDTSNVILGGIISFNSPADALLRLGAAMRVQAVVANTSFAVTLPFNAAPSSSAACTAQMMEAGGSASSGTGYGFDGHTKSTTLECWRDDWAANVRSGSKYACGLKKGSSSAEYYYHSIPAAELYAYMGKTISIGGYVKCPSGATWRVFVNDDVDSIRYGSTVSTTGYSWSETSVTISSGITYLHIGFELAGTSGDVFYLSEPVFGVGDYIGAFAHEPQITPEYFVPIVKMSPPVWINAGFSFPSVADAGGTYSFLFDVYAETNGVLAPEVKAINITIEGVNGNAVVTGTGGNAIATRDVVSPPIKYGPIMFQQVINVKTACSGIMTLAADGTGRIYGNASDGWGNVSMDINGILV